LKRLALLYVLIIFLLLQLSGITFIAVAFIALFAAAEGYGEENLLKKIIPSVFLVVFYFLINMSFGMFGKQIYIPSLVFLFLPLLLLMVLFNSADNAKDTVLNTRLIYRKTSIAAVSVKTVITGLLGVLGYYFMSRHNYFFSLLVYAACFAVLISIFKLERTGCAFQQPVMPEEPAGPMPPVDTVKISVLFSMAMVFILVVRAYSSIMAFKTMEPLLYVITAAFFSRYIFMYSNADSAPENDDKKLQYIDAAVIVFFTIISMIINTKDINLIPPGAYTDDFYHFIRTIGARAEGNNIPVFYDEMPILASSLPYWLIAQVHHLLRSEITLVSLRTYYAVFGSFSVIFVYLAAREIFNRRTAVLAAFLHTFMLYQIITSRATEHFAPIPLFTTAAVYFFFVAARKGNPLYFILSGLMISFGMYFYNAAKLIPFIFALYMLLSLSVGIKNNDYIWSRLRGFFLLVLAALIAFFPIINYILSPNSIYLGRVGGMNYLRTINGIGQFIQYFPDQAALVIRNLFRDSGVYGVSTLPSSNFFDPVSAILLLAGLSITIALWKRPKYLFIIAWLAVGLSGIAFAVQVDGIYLHRGGPVMPALVILIAMAMDLAATSFEKIFGRAGKATTPVILAVLLFPVAFTAINNYFVVYKNDPSVRFFRNAIMRDAVNYANSNKGKNVFFPAIYTGTMYSNINVLRPNLRVPEDFIDVSKLDFAKIYNEEKRDVVIIAEGIYHNFMPIYKEYFPNAVIKTHWNYDYWIFGDTDGYKKLYGWNDPDYVINGILERGALFAGDPAKPEAGFVTCDIPYSDIKALYGFQAYYYKAGKLIFEGKFMNGEMLNQVSCDSVILKGSLYAPVSGDYSFCIEGATVSELTVRGESRKRGIAEMLAGLNPVKIVLNDISGGACNITWLVPGHDEMDKIPAGSVISSEKTFGLSYKTVYKGKVMYEMQDYTINTRIYQYYVFDRTPYDIIQSIYSGKDYFYDREWSGYMNIDEPGYYSFIIKPISDDCEAKIDGITVYRIEKYTKFPGNEVFLTKGKHRIYLKQHYSETISGGNYVMLQYKKREWRAPAEVSYKQLSMK
jgi:4-amino-4-deoxy-L-arabinose transferase-like glycosyltransferase